MNFVSKVYRKIISYIYIIYLKMKYGKRIKIGKKFSFRKGLIINILDKGELYLGDNIFFNNNCSINVHKKVTIGNNNIFGENVKIYDYDHAFHEKNFYNNFYESEINIGDNNWFCSNTIILRKAKVGNNCVIGAGVVLNNNIDDNMLVKNKNEISIEKIERG